MKYKNVIPAIFVERNNRFIATVIIDGAPATVHVKNTGRCRELLVPGATVWLSVADDPSRRTKYDLVAVEKKREGNTPLLINMDSQAPNAAVAEWLPASGLFLPDARFCREVTHGNSRFDFAVYEGEKTTFLEVKGVTLESSGVLRFPDAPTERGVKHLCELTALASAGYGAAVLFLVQMNEAIEFRPNDETHKAFGDALRAAKAGGVSIYCYKSAVYPDAITVTDPIPVKL